MDPPRAGITASVCMGLFWPASGPSAPPQLEGEIVPTPEISVVIASHNGAGRIGLQLEALATQTDAPPFEVIVVDNGSSDGTADVVRTFSATTDATVPVELVGCARPGKGAAVRRALLRSRSRFVGFVDDVGGASSGARHAHVEGTVLTE